MEIRPERPGDEAAIFAVVAAAFGQEDEARLVDALRERDAATLSLVAEDDGAIEGHVLFSPVTIDDTGFTGSAQGLAPLSVRPDRQRLGIGSALTRAGIDRLRDDEHDAVAVLGHPSYYPRFGFRPSVAFGIGCEYDVPPEVFMLLELREGSLDGVTGTVAYHAAFAAL